MNSNKRIGDIVSMEITEEEYTAALEEGIAPDEMLSVGKHYGIRGGIAIRRQITAEDWERIRRGETMVAIRPDAVMVKLSPEIAAEFPTSEAVNEALRQILREKKAA